MALLEKHLRIRPSVIPNAGRGLFTLVDIPKGTLIVEYKGRLRKWKEVEAEDGENSYIFQINTRWAVDAEKAMSTFGRYANDARGERRSTSHRNNAEYVVKGLKVYIKSTRKIHAGTEVFCDYGRAYWTADMAQKRERAREKAKAKAKAKAKTRAS